MNQRNFESWNTSELRLLESHWSCFWFWCHRIFITESFSQWHKRMMLVPGSGPLRSSDWKCSWTLSLLFCQVCGSFPVERQFPQTRPVVKLHSCLFCLLTVSILHSDCLSVHTWTSSMYRHVLTEQRFLHPHTQMNHSTQSESHTQLSWLFST